MSDNILGGSSIPDFSRRWNLPQSHHLAVHQTEPYPGRETWPSHTHSVFRGATHYRARLCSA